MSVKNSVEAKAAPRGLLCAMACSGAAGLVDEVAWLLALLLIAPCALSIERLQAWGTLLPLALFLPAGLCTWLPLPRARAPLARGPSPLLNSALVLGLPLPLGLGILLLLPALGSGGRSVIIDSTHGGDGRQMDRIGLSELLEDED